MANEAIGQPFSLSYFADQRVWLAWRNEIRHGTKTKVPYSAVGRKAKSDDPSTWIRLEPAATLAEKYTTGDLGGGIGIILGIDCGDGWRLGGIDLDTCMTSDNVDDGTSDDWLEPWAGEIIGRIDSYSEVSPSLTGFKIFFHYRASDLSRLRDLMGTEHGKMFKRFGKVHPPAIEFHVGNRYFAVTGDVPDGFPTTIRAVAFDELAWVITEAGPRFVRQEVEPQDISKPVDNSVVHDQSRSGVAFRKVIELRRRGKIKSYLDMSSALLTDPETAGWTQEKGLSNQERELKRLWDKTTPAPGTVADEQDEHAEASEIGGSDTRYQMGPRGLFYHPNRPKKQAKAGEEMAKPTWLSPPFEVVARTRDPDSNWGKLLRWNDHDGHEVTWVMPGRLLGGHRDELWQALYERGLEISSALEARNLLLAYLTRANPTRRAELVSRLGWHGDENDATFVLPDQVVGGKDEVEITYTGPIPGSPYRLSGSVDNWRDRIGLPCVGNSRLIFATSVAFAVPLLWITGEESGGFHLRGGSRTGKTTASRVASSVWGGGDGPLGYLKTWRATSNGLEGIAEQHCDALLCLDEMGQVDAREAGEIAYMLANSGGKQRAGRDGSARRSKHWRILFLSTGEISLADKMTEIGKKPRAGQEVRLVDIPADAGAGLGMFENLHGCKSAREFAELLKAATLECYGAPVREYLANLVLAYQDDPAGMTAAFRGLRDDFIRDHLPADSSGQVISVCGRFGLVAAAGEFAAGLGLTGWPAGEATRAAVTCFTAWLDQRGTLGDHDIEAGIQQVIAYVEVHGGSRFEELPPAGEWQPTVSNRVGFRRFDPQSSVWNYYVLPNAFRSELAKGFNSKEVASVMAKRGLIVPGKDKNSQVLRMGRHGTMRVYALKPGIINVPEPKPSPWSNWIERQMNEPPPSGDGAGEAVNQILH